MPKCEARKPDGEICGRDASDSSYFWYHDPHGRVDRKFSICQDHSNYIIDETQGKEKEFITALDFLYLKIDANKQKIDHKMTATEQKQAVYDAINQGLPRPHFDNMQELYDKRTELWDKVKKLKKIKSKLTLKTCRKCNWPLTEPNEKDAQYGEKVAHADFHSGKGSWRIVLLFHSEHGIAWLIRYVALNEKELKYIKPQMTGQTVLEV